MDLDLKGILKLVIIVILVLYVVGIIAPLIALPAGIWVLIRALVIVWFVFSLVKLF